MSALANLTYVGPSAWGGPTLSIYENSSLPPCAVSGIEQQTRVSCTMDDGTACTGNLGSGECLPTGLCAANNGGCDPLTHCAEIGGSVQCGSCPVGYTGTGSSGCIDLDECALATADCAPGAACTNTPGSFACICPVGTLDVAGDGTECPVAPQLAAPAEV